MTSVNCFPLVFLAIIFSGQTSGHFVKKCCPEGELLESVPGHGGDIFEVKCIGPNLKKVPKERTKDSLREPFDMNALIARLDVHFPNNTLASGGNYEVLIASSDICDGFKIKDPYQVKTLYTDAFLVDDRGNERPYDCVDFVLNSSETRPTGIFVKTIIVHVALRREHVLRNAAGKGSFLSGASMDLNVKRVITQRGLLTNIRVSWTVWFWKQFPCSTRGETWKYVTQAPLSTRSSQMAASSTR